METTDYVSLLLTKIVELEGSGWHVELDRIINRYLKVSEIDDLDQIIHYNEAFKKHYDGIIMVLDTDVLHIFLDLFKELRERQKKLEYLYFCCDKEIEPSHYSSLQKFKYENR